ncbi:MAG: putative ABC transporter permease [Clostridia bacterium]|nr:putative ABC transporter permease [Clostridia bacterium]
MSVIGVPTYFDLALYLLVYSLIGWLVEVTYYIVTKRQFLNRGFMSMPLILSYGVTFDLLIVALPTLRGNHVLCLIGTMVIAAVVDSVFDGVTRIIGSKMRWEPERNRLFSGNGRGFAASAAIAAAYYLVYLVVHPVLMGLALLIPRLILKAAVIASLILLALDLISVVYVVRTGERSRFEDRQRTVRDRLVQNLSDRIWKRLQKAYPGIESVTEEEAGAYTFAKGICWDKLIWVFLASALVGDLIEMGYCRLTGGTWMSRSSVLYGPFSIVWGMGAVVLTLTLQRLAQKDDRYVFLAGFVIGGVYEYMCSVFTELVFGTVFWDYSHMPLNIGGRTNVLYCFFWGILSVVWIKIIYPRMSFAIEKLPVLAGKLMTWAIVLIMVCNGLLTGAAMLRYHSRASRPEAANVLDAFLDEHYDDAFMEKRWPNMVVTDLSRSIQQE